MVFEKIVCDRCKSEMSHPEGRKIWLSGVGREGGYDLCNECYYDLYHWIFEPNKYVVKFNRANGEVNANKGVLDQINEKQDSLRATCKAWDEAISRDGYVD